MVANIITGCRIPFSLIMLACPAFSVPFYGFYIAAGITDMIDGTVARKTGTAGEFGARLDTVADIVFTVAAACRLLPLIALPIGIWIWIGLIAVIRVVNIASGFWMHKRFVSLHTVADKIAGLLLFLLPLTIPWVDIVYASLPVCAVATFASVQEGHFIRTRKI